MHRCVRVTTDPLMQLLCWCRRRLGQGPSVLRSHRCNQPQAGLAVRRKRKRRNTVKPLRCMHRCCHLNKRGGERVRCLLLQTCHKPFTEHVTAFSCVRRADRACMGALASALEPHNCNGQILLRRQRHKLVRSSQNAVNFHFGFNLLFWFLSTV